MSLDFSSLELAVDLTEEQITIVRQVLDKHLHALKFNRVVAFGSRVKSSAHKHSDLDLAIDAPEAISLFVLESLREDLEDSMLPFKVDIVDLTRVTLGIKTNILENHVTLWQPADIKST